MNVKSTSAESRDAFIWISKYNAHKPRGSLVDDAAESLAQLLTGVLRHMLKLCVESLVYQLIDGSAEQVCVPYA